MLKFFKKKIVKNVKVLLYFICYLKFKKILFVIWIYNVKVRNFVVF